LEALVRLFVLFAALLAQAAPQPPTDLDRFMEQALQRRDVDRKTLNDYVLDEVESFVVLAPGRVPVARMRREYTWYVRDGIHVRSPIKVDGVPISEADRRAYEDHWIKSELSRREFRTKRDEKRAAQGLGPALSAPSINEPRFVAESYFMDFKFEPGNYYLAGKETLDGHEVLKIDYLPTKLFDDSKSERIKEERAVDPANDTGDKKPAKDKDAKEKPKSPAQQEKERREQEKDKKFEDEIQRKLDKTSQVTLWVDPASHQIVKYTFNNVWMDFLPAGWLVKLDDLKAQMQMGQPFPGVWLPHEMTIHAGATIALGSMEIEYHRAFSNYREADVTSKIKIPKDGGQ
jgi:hypothetical protein